MTSTEAKSIMAENGSANNFGDRSGELGEWMEHEWSNVTELGDTLTRQLEVRHTGLVTKLWVTLFGDTLTLHGEVASEDCKGDAKRLLLGFDGVFKVRNELVVAGFLAPASDGADDYFERNGTSSYQVGRDSDDVLSPTSEFPTNHRPPEIRKGSETDVTKETHRGQSSSCVAEIGDSVEVLRHPTIESQGELRPGKEVRIEVDLTAEALQGEPAISLGHFPTDWDEIPIRVQLFAPWAIEVIPEEEAVTIAADGTSRPASFRLAVSDDYIIGTTAQLHISFQHGTRVCGHLSRDLSLPVSNVVDQSDIDRVATPMIAIAAGASGPSLSVSIRCNDDGSQIWMWSAMVPGRVQQESGQINLSNGEQEFANKLLSACPDFESTVFRRKMAGIGQRLWEATPEHFQSAYAELRTKLGGCFSIQFISDDPHIPWEMMKPDLDNVDHLFLEHPVARWPLSKAKPRRHQFPGGALLSFVPNYAAGAGALPSARAEGEWLCANLDGVACTATSDLFFEVLDGNYEGPVGVLHFAGHGSIDTGEFDCGIVMEDRTIGVEEVNQSRVVLGSQDATLVVLNACETSAGSRLLGMNTGWGVAIAARDFGGLVAPMWEVQDDVALAVVQEALPPLVNGSASLGESLLKARKLKADTSISAFAYLAHGDVMAKFPKSR